MMWATGCCRVLKWLLVQFKPILDAPIFLGKEFVDTLRILLCHGFSVIQDGSLSVSLDIFQSFRSECRLWLWAAAWCSPLFPHQQWACRVGSSFFLAGGPVAI